MQERSQVYSQIRITNINQRAVNSSGQQCGIDIQNIVAQSFRIITNCFSEVIRIVFLDHFNTAGTFVIYDLRPEDHADIIQIISLNGMDAADFIRKWIGIDPVCIGPVPDVASSNRDIPE